MRKAILAAAVILSFALPTGAFASDWDPEDDAPQIQSTRELPPDNDRDDWKHIHLDALFDDVAQVPVPPVGIRPNRQHFDESYELPLVDGAGLNNPDAAEDFKVVELDNGSATKESINPYKTSPLQIKNLVLTRTTPSDEFLQNALLWGVILAATAFALLTAASANSLRLKRKTKKP